MRKLKHREIKTLSRGHTSGHTRQNSEPGQNAAGYTALTLLPCRSAISTQGYFGSIPRITPLDYRNGSLVCLIKLAILFFFFFMFLHKLNSTFLTLIFPDFFKRLGSSRSNPAGYIIFTTPWSLFLTGKFTFLLPQISSETTFNT